jgi:NADPH-dependent curcumin reductase CurA
LRLAHALNAPARFYGLIHGAEIIGTASAAKHSFLRDRGVAHVIDYRTGDYEAEVRRLTGGRGVHIVLDAMGGEHWRKGYRCLAPTARAGRRRASLRSGPQERRKGRARAVSR